MNLFITETAPNNKTIFDCISIAIWPIAIVVICLIFRKPLIDIISRLTKAKVLGAEFEAPQTNNQIIQTPANVGGAEGVNRAFIFYSPQTTGYFIDLVLQETGIATIENSETKIDTLQKYGAILYLKLYYDSIYNDIFGSQITLLQHLNSVANDGVVEIEVFYNSIKTQNEAFYRDYAFEDYLQYLINKTLVRRDNDVISLTYLGADFLRYLTDVRKNLFKKY